MDPTIPFWSRIMSVNLSIKEVPEDIAERLRQRAARNHRSLQGELMAIIEQAAADPVTQVAGTKHAWAQGWKTIEQAADEARRRYPDGTASSVDFIRVMRDSRHGDPKPPR
jgi:plasmid stability protein